MFLASAKMPAKMRVSRAIEKLRTIFARRGVVAPSATLVAMFTAHGNQAAPAGAVGAAAAAFTKGKVASSSTLTLTKGILKFMAWTKLRIAAVATIGILLTAATATFVAGQHALHSEPVYQGRPVSHWIRVLNSMTSDQQGMSYYIGEQPILEIGPPALPYLLKTLRHQDNFVADAYGTLWPKMPRRFQSAFPEPVFSSHASGLCGARSWPFWSRRGRRGA